MRYVLAAAVLMLSGCKAFMPPDAVPYDPPASYRALWAEVEACTGRTGNFDELHFYTEPGDRVSTTDEGIIGGWTQGTDILIPGDYILIRLVVKHEMIHALGVHGHPQHPFFDPCHAMYEDFTGPTYLKGD